MPYHFIPDLVIKVLLSMYKEEARFTDKGKGFEITDREEDGHRLVAE